MRIVFELSGEHPSLPISEVISCLEGERIGYDYVDTFGSFLIINLKNGMDQLGRVCQRLSLSHFVDIFLFSSEPSKNDLLERAKRIKIKLSGTFRVRCENRSRERIDSLDLERSLGEIYARSNKVDLVKPDDEIRILLSRERWLVCRRFFEIDRRQFELRKANRRPFFLPISMHPRLARCMVNLSGVRKGEKLLDPFCGTGGILIEAGLIGAKVLGSDVQGWISEGCKRNLEHFGIDDYDIQNLDVGEIGSFGKVDAIVTDFPYGRASTTRKEPVEKLYRRSFLSISDVLKHGSKLVCAIPDMELAKMGCEFMDLVEIHAFKVHGNLTRYICVFTK